MRSSAIVVFPFCWSRCASTESRAGPRDPRLRNHVLKYGEPMHKSVIAQDRVSGTDLTREELQRYSRHLIMPEVTAEGQKRLKAARVLCIGAGGLGSPAALYLTAAGVGTLGIVDFDRVEYHQSATTNSPWNKGHWSQQIGIGTRTAVGYQSGDRD